MEKWLVLSLLSLSLALNAADNTPAQQQATVKKVNPADPEANLDNGGENGSMEPKDDEDGNEDDDVVIMEEDNEDGDADTNPQNDNEDGSSGS